MYQALLQSLDHKTQIYRLVQFHLQIQPFNLIQENFVTQLSSTHVKNPDSMSTTHHVGIRFLLLEKEKPQFILRKRTLFFKSIEKTMISMS